MRRNNRPVDKATLRDDLQRKRREYVRTLSDEQHAAWAHACARSVRSVLPSIIESAHVASYEGLPSEPPTSALNEELASAGVSVWLPAYQDEQGAYLPELIWRGSQGQTLPSDEFCQRVDVVVVPALAATAGGERLGKGRGYYDKFLATLTTVAPTVPTVAVVRAAEVLPSLPTEGHDVPVTRVAAVPDVPRSGSQSEPQDVSDAGQ